MTDRPPDKHVSSTRNRTQPVLWDRLSIDDDAQVDPDLIAAFAEGRLTGEEADRVRRSIERSPAAMQLLDELCELHQESTGDLSVAELRAIPLTTVRPSSPARQTFSIQRLALAASLLMAVGMSVFAWQQWKTSSKLERSAVALLEENSKYRRALALSYKEQLSLLSAGRPVMVGETSPTIVAQAMHRATSRGGTNELDDEQRKQQAENLRASADQLLATADKTDLELAVEHAASRLLTGNVTQAYQDIAVAAEKWPDSPEIMNLRAAVLLTDAEARPFVESVPLVQQAEQILKQLVAKHPTFSPAWFNLAMALESNPTDERPQEAIAAWREYLKHETREDLRTVVRQMKDL